MNNIVQTKRTPVAGRRPTGLMAGELYFNFADRTIGCVDENGTPIDIVTAIPVGPTAPADPVPGILWYRTASPAGLYVWFVDADSSQWVQVAGGGSGGGGGGGGGGGASVEIGDTPPEAPVEGQFWFSTVEPVGLFIWLVDADSEQWVQVGGNGSPSPGLTDFATIGEARAGARADVVMSPALVQSRVGGQGLSITGLTQVTFDALPPEATEVDITININCPANAVVDMLTPDDAGANYPNNRMLFGPTYTPPVVSPSTSILLDTNATAGTVQGSIKMVRNNSGSLWFTKADLRRGSQLMMTTGIFVVTNVPLTLLERIRLRCVPAANAGEVTLRWRI